MKKQLSLLKAVMSEDMSLFKYKTTSKTSKIKKVLIPLTIAILCMYAVGTYAFLLAEPLHKVNLTFIMLTIFLMVITVTSFIEGMYKSQGILFDAKDNDLLFSLPIEKRKIFTIRLFKLLSFQFLFNLIFLIPTFLVYIFYEKPAFNFYFISFVFLFLIPIIPTVLSGILGYLVKFISTKFKAKRLAQLILSIVIMVPIFYISFNIGDFINNIVKNATSINDMITKIYYPIGAYINLIQDFNLLTLIKVILVNIIPLIIFIYLGQIYYFKVISKSKEYGRIKVKVKKKSIKKHSPLMALVNKEISRFFSSPIYILNTTFGIILMLAITIGMSIKLDSFLSYISTMGLSVSEADFNKHLSSIFCQLIVFVGCLTQITASSISLEGRSFNITKSLPVEPDKILLSKIISSSIITFPLMIIADLILTIKFNISLTDTILILLFTITVPTFSALVGLITNLKFPKMNASNDTEVVKQSMSVMISTFTGMGVFMLSMYLTYKFFNHINIFTILELVGFIIVDIVLWFILKIWQ